MIEFIRWRDRVLSQVRFKPDRKAIREELDAHYEDKVADLERLGYDRKLAESRALEAMGDAVEIGKAFDKVHKPWLGWLWKVTSWLAVILVLATVWNVWIGDGYYQIKTRLGHIPDVVDYEPDGKPFDFDGDRGFRRLFWKPMTERVERAGQTIQLEYMALWKQEFDEGGHIYYATMVFTATNPLFWEGGPDLRELLLESGTGHIYRELKHTKGTSEVGYFMVSEHNLFRSEYKLQVYLGTEPVDYVKVTYPYGDTWSWQVDLTEVDWQ